MSERPDLLKTLGPQGRKALEDASQTLQLAGGETLFEKGDPPSALYLLISGSLGIYSYNANGETQLQALIKAGETVGEMGVISGQPRNATVIAIRDSKLLQLSKTKFDQLLKSEPELMAGINRLLVYRLRRATSGATYQLEPRAVAFVPAHSGLDIPAIAQEFAQRISASGRSAKLIGIESANQSSEWFAKQEESHDHILLCANMADETWLRICHRQADRIIVVADGSRKPCCEMATELLSQRAAHQLADLVLLQPDNAKFPQRTQAWLDLIRVNRHFHLRRANDRDWARLVRVVGGRGIGLVLSGGGARAYAHIGALQAFEEAGIPIDFIGGVSMGAVIAAAYATGAGVTELKERVRVSFVDSNPLSDYALPIVSLVRGKKVKRLLGEHFGDLDIADMWSPFYCVSSNLTTGDVHIHSKGRVADALLASIALPGILPPVITTEGVLADGAVINNLPVDVMRAVHRGPVAAIDVARDLALDPDWLAHEVKMSPFWRLLRPPIVPILIRAGTVSGEEQNRRQASLADLVIEPPLGDIDIRDWKAFDQAIDTGYRFTSELLKDNRHILRSHSRVSVV